MKATQENGLVGLRPAVEVKHKLVPCTNNMNVNTIEIRNIEQQWIADLIQ